MADEPLIPDLNVEDVITALRANRGNVTKTALALDKGRSVLLAFISPRAELCALVNDLREAIIDRAEDNIFTAVEAGDIGQSNFVVSTLGKNRGWSNRQEVTGADGKDLAPPQIIIRRYGPEDDVPPEDAGEHGGS